MHVHAQRQRIVARGGALHALTRARHHGAQHDLGAGTRQPLVGIRSQPAFQRRRTDLERIEQIRIGGQTLDRSGRDAHPALDQRCGLADHESFGDRHQIQPEHAAVERAQECRHAHPQPERVLTGLDAAVQLHGTRQHQKADLAADHADALQLLRDLVQRLAALDDDRAALARGAVARGQEQVVGRGEERDQQQEPGEAQGAERPLRRPGAARVGGATPSGAQVFAILPSPVFRHARSLSPMRPSGWMLVGSSLGMFVRLSLGARRVVAYGPTSPRVPRARPALECPLGRRPSAAGT